MAVTEIAMGDIAVSDDRAREDLGDLEELASSIQAVGQLQPIVVRSKGDGYELVAGERRFRAQELLGAMMIRAEVRDLDDDQVLVAEAVENGQRKSFTPSEYAWLGLQLEKRAKTEDMAGKLPNGERLSERVAKALGVSDRTYRKARDIVSLAGELNDVPGGNQDAWQVCDRLVQQMDEAGKVDGVHRQFVAFRRLLELSAHEDATVAEMATATTTRAVDERGLDLTLEVEGIESFAAQIPAGDVADPAPSTDEADEHDVALGGSDVSPPETSEPTPAWKDLSGAQREANETPTTAGGDDDADGKGSAGPSEMATEHDASAAPAADDAGESASEPPATPAGARPEGWPPRAESHPSLGAMKTLGFGFSAAFYAAGRQLADLILDSDTPEEAVERLQAGPGHLSDEQLDYVLAHFDVPAPAPDADPGSEPPAPEGVNEDHALEGGEQAPDPSTPVTATTEVEGEAPAGAVPAPLPAGDGEDEFRRSSSPSTTYRRSEKKRPVPMAEFGRLRNVLTEAASIVATVEATDVEPVLAHIDDVDQFIDDVQGAIETLTPFLADLRLLARPPG